MINLAIVLMNMLIRGSRQACEIQAITPPVFSGGYLISGAYDTTSQPDWSLTTRDDGSIEFKSDMFLLSSGNIAYMDMFHSFAKFVSPADTTASCSVACSFHRYSSSACQGALSPDALYGLNIFDLWYSRWLRKSTVVFSANQNSDLSSTTWDSCVKCTTSGGTVEIKNIRSSLQGSCDSKLPSIDYTLLGTNSYKSIDQTAQIFNIQGFQAHDSTNCGISTLEVQFLDFDDLASVPGLTETAREFCIDRVSNAQCDGASDLYLNWAFTQSYAALRIQLKATFTNMNSAQNSFTSQIISLKVELCESVVLTSSLASSYSVQKGTSFTQINVNAVSSISDCVVDSSSYASNSTTSAVTIDSSGAFNIDTSAAFATTFFQYTVLVNSRTVQSSSFSVRVFEFDCSAKLSNSESSVDRPYTQAASVIISLASLFPWTTSDSNNCPFTTIKVFASGSSTELYSGDYSTAAYSFDSSSQGSSSYLIEAFSNSYKTQGILNIHICGAETVSANVENIYFSTEQDSSGSLEVIYSQYIAFFTITNGIHFECEKNPNVEFLDTAGVALSDSRFTTGIASAGDGTTSIMIDRVQAFAEFEFKIKITTIGQATVDQTARAFVYAKGTSCSYTGTPATQNVAVAFPVAATVNYDLTKLITYASNDVSNIVCPLNQILWYSDTGSGVVFQQAHPKTKQAPQLAVSSPSGLTQMKLNIGLTHLGTILFEQTPASVVNFYVCGNEVLNLASSNSYDHSATETSSVERIPLATYGAWFTLDVSATDAVTECGVITYELFESDKISAVAANIAYIDKATSDLVIVQSLVQAQTTYYMKATTLGSKTQFKQLNIEIIVNCSLALAISPASVDYAFPPGSIESLTLNKIMSFSTKDPRCILTTIKTFDSTGATEQASASYDTATLTVDGSSRLTTTKIIRVYDQMVPPNYVEGILNIHICGDEIIQKNAFYMFVTQTADATAQPVEVMQKDYSQFISLSNQLHHSCGFKILEIYDEANTNALTDTRFSVASGGTSFFVAKQTAHAQFIFTLRVKTVGQVSDEIKVAVLIRDSSASCTYSGVPIVIKAIAYPLTSNVTLIATSDANYTSTDISDTNCPLNHGIKYLPSEDGVWNFNRFIIWNDSYNVSVKQGPGLLYNFRLSAGLVNIASVVTKQSTETEHKYYVCGLETLSLSKNESYHFVGTISQTDAIITSSVYHAWFTFDASASGATTSCSVNLFELFQSDKTTALASNVAYIDTNTGNLIIKQTQLSSKSQYFLKATTMGSVTKFKELVIEVKQILKIERYLEKDPDQYYDVNIGKMNSFELGKYLGEDISDFAGYYTITNIKLGSDQDISEETMSDNFLLKTEYLNQQVTLEIDLTGLSQLFSGSKIEGKLEIFINHDPSSSYKIGFNFLGSDDKIEDTEPRISNFGFTGVIIEERDKELLAQQIQEKRMPEKKEGQKEVTAKPYMYPPEMKPSGEVQITFSESMKKIDQVYDRDLSNTMQISIYSFEFKKEVVGAWMAKPSEQKTGAGEDKRILSSASEDDAEIFDGFGWFINGDQDDGLTVKLDFEKPQLMSRLQGGYDEVKLKILDKSIFRSQNSDSPLDEVRPAEFQGVVPQQMSKAIVVQIDATMGQQKAGVASGGLLAFVIAKITGGGMQALWGMMAVLQEVSFNALVRVKYPPAVEYRQKLMMTFAKVDVLNIDWFWEENFQFEETEALTPKFEMSGMETKNFLFNTGSFAVNFASIISSSVVFYLIKYFGKKHTTNPYVLALTEKFMAPMLGNSIILALYQFSTDAILCSIIQFYAYLENGSEGLMQYPAERANLALAIILSGSCIGITVHSIYLVKTQDDIKTKLFKSRNMTIIEGLDLTSRTKAQFNNVKIIQRMTTAVVFVFISQGCIQTQVLVLKTLLFMMRFFQELPYEEAFDNQTQKFNFLIIYSTLLCQIAMSLPSLSDAMMQLASQVYIYSVYLGVGGNMIFAAIAAYQNISKYRNKKAQRKPYLLEYDRLQQLLRKDKQNKDLQKEADEMEWVLLTFKIRDLKHLLEENGHDSKPFTSDWLELFEQHPAAWKFIVEQTKANEDVKQASQSRLEKLEKRVKSYQNESEQAQVDVNRMSDENNNGQYEDFESRHYRFNRAEMNKVEFKPSYQLKKKRQFGRIQNRHLQRFNQNRQSQSRLVEIAELSEETQKTKKDEEDKEPEIKFTPLEKQINKALSPKKVFKNEFIQKIVFGKKKEIYDRVVSRGFETSENVQREKLSVFKEQSGHRVQNDKILEIQNEFNKPITQNLVVGNQNPQFAAAYKSITKHKVRRLISLIPVKIAKKAKDKEEKKSE